jgi:hypothetical protein
MFAHKATGFADRHIITFFSRYRNAALAGLILIFKGRYYQGYGTE